MCGIVALLAPRGKRLSRSTVERGVKALERRGPDGSGIHESSRSDHVLLGHTRLAIIDPEGGAQPISIRNNDDATRSSAHRADATRSSANSSANSSAYREGDATIVFNGELYGYREIRAELEAVGHRFRSRSDAEVVLWLYRELGPARMLERMRGEFAFVIWDEREEVLFAARDRFGVKPLLYSEHDGVLHLASQAKALFAMGVPARWDHASFLQTASMQYPLPDATLFDNVRVLAPGHFLLAHDGHVRVRSYWDQDYPTEEELRDRTRFGRTQAVNDDDAFRAAARSVREQLEDAVRVRLVADVPIAFQLSGGIDSSAVLGLASKILESEGGRAPEAFTVAFEDARYDERTIAMEMAELAGAKLHVINASTDALLRELPQAVIDGEGLAINAHIAAKRMLARAVHEAGFKVVLTGEGSDEVFAGYAHLRADLASSSADLASSSSTAGLAGSNGVSAGLMLPHGDALDVSAVAKTLGFVPTWLRAKASLGYRVHALLADEFLAQHRSRDPYALAIAHFDVPRQLAGRGRVEQSLYTWSKLALEGYILRTLGDGMEMSHSIEGRLPFLDHRLFELVRTLPTSFKIRHGVEKAVLREAIGDVVTERLRTRQKHPFLAPPLLASSETKLPGLAADLLGSSSLPPFFDASKIRALLDRLPNASAEERTALEPALMLALSATILHRHYRL